MYSFKTPIYNGDLKPWKEAILWASPAMFKVYILMDPERGWAEENGTKFLLRLSINYKFMRNLLIPATISWGM